ncbi:MAG: HAD family hydrolase [Candidatus Promineifilaceae bacterium]
MTITSPSHQPALFLDRDGVIIENRASYVRRWQDVHIYPQALEALRMASTLPLKIIVVTNQSAVGRGILPLAIAQEINSRLMEEIEEFGGRVDGVFMCPHAPQDHCRCRKPQPGLLLNAAKAHQINLRHSIMIGDALTDLAAGRAAGTRVSALVKTGRGIEQVSLPKANEYRPFPLYDNLFDALKELLL